MYQEIAMPNQSMFETYTDFWQHSMDRSFTAFWFDTAMRNMLTGFFLPNTWMIDLNEWQDQWRKATLCSNS